MTQETQIGNKLFGVYRGQVIQHLTHGYCKIYIPGIYPEEWKDTPQLIPPAEQAASLFAGANNGSGVFTYPNIGSIVWCFFANNDQNYPIYFASSLGGENAFGQYAIGLDTVTTEIENEDGEKQTVDQLSSSHHVITSGKTHIEWYENGKLSVQVEDPDRRDALVDYTNNYIGQISDDVVSARPLCELVEDEQISNIHCKLVLDNNSNLNGVISVQTHLFDLSNSNMHSMHLTNDNDFILDNTGKMQLNMLSTYNSIDKKTKIDSIANNVLSMSVPGITTLNNSLKFNKIDLQKSNVDKFDSENIYENQVSGSVLQKNTLVYSTVSQENGTNFLTSDVQSYASTDGISQHMIRCNDIKTSTAGITEISNDSLLARQNKANGFLNEIEHNHQIVNGQTIVKQVKNKIDTAFKYNDDDTNIAINLASNVFESNIPIILTTAKDEIDAKTATIERRIDNKLPDKLIISIDKTDANESTRKILLTDRTTNNEATILLDTKIGKLTLNICAIDDPDNKFSTMQLDVNGNIYAESSSSLTLKSKTVSIQSENQLDIVADTVKLQSNVNTAIVSPAINLDSSTGHTIIQSTTGVKSF